MSIDTINNYGASGISNTSATNSTSSSALTMDDFFQLLIAQLANQDMYNTVDDSEFMTQLAQFSMVQALSDLSQASMTAYGVNLIGKEVTLATIKNGTLETDKGIVEAVNLYNGNIEIIVDGKAYALSNVMQVKEPNIIIPDADSLNENNLINKLSELVDEISDLADSVKANSTAGTSGGADDTGESEGTEGEGDV